ncbi:GGDEF domain-containing protein [Shewanella inventionis]|uniref:diguanylate cyclase n=1 Tax=Shewanella inventionis TaxID=1738770 RepID=A0ABQ1INL5_9GAMM|nr:GGDEF domain-containing protein [Shewanella inventionis]MCL1157677.1 GGDEF domain-containing protein [Shewanella inventionis]GGB48469.1 GGDEF domain-containing protein [Shewanella inventionis]
MLELIKKYHPNQGASQQARVISLFSLVGMSMTFLMGAISFLGSDNALTVVLFLASLTYLLSFLFVKRLNVSVSANLIIYSLYLLMFYLVFSGGVSQTGPLWIFIVAPVSVYVLGLRQGIMNLLIFLFVISAIMFMPQSLIAHAAYSNEFKIRLILSFLTMSFLSALYEHLRMLSYKNALEISRQYQQLAMRDPLTKLANRRNAAAILEQEKARLQRNNEPLSVLLCDLDHFKSVNDKYGHNAGDMVLTELSALFTEQVRQQDCVARWGGEEFLIILPQTTSEQAGVIAEKIRSSVENHTLQFLDNKIQVTISIGISQLSQDQTIDELINNADKCLYQAKTLGRNRVHP